MYMYSAGLKILLAVMAVASFQTVESISGCNCTRIHPQQHYCRANYVMRGRVVLIQWQLIQDLHTEPPLVTETMTDSTLDMMTSPNQPEATQPAWPTAQPSTQDQEEFNDTLPAHRQDNQQARRQNKGLLRRNHIVNQEPWNYEIIYTVKIQDVYKKEGGELLMEEQEVEITSPYPGMGFCGVELRAGKSYILAGGEVGQINKCDWIQEYRDVSKLQKRGLKNNYKQFCDKCQIETCHDQECRRNLPPTTCAYLPSHDDDIQHGIGYHTNDCTARHARCYAKGNKANKCIWTTSGSDLRSCQRQ